MAVSSSTRMAVLFAWGKKCFYCGHDAEVLDHIVPKSKGGTDHPNNLLAACVHCNDNKGDRWLPPKVLAEAKASAQKIANFVTSAAEVFKESVALARDRAIYGSHPLREGVPGYGRVRRAQRTQRPSRIIAAESAAIVRTAESSGTVAPGNPEQDKSPGE